MSVLVKLLRGSDDRPTRLHDAKGHFAFRSLSDVGDATVSLVTTALRLTVGYRMVKPWIAAEAVRFIKKQLSPEARIFEWGCGMSTIWYMRNYREVHGVDHDRQWYEILKEKLKSPNLHYAEGQAYVDVIRRFEPAYFDMIVIDGALRLDCFNAAPEFLKPGGILLIDNSDADQQTKGDMYKIDRLLERGGFEVHRFVGWAPGNIFPQETTVCIKR